MNSGSFLTKKYSEDSNNDDIDIFFNENKN